MKFTRFFVEWFCVWICHLCLVAGAASGDVILWEQPTFVGPVGSTAFAGWLAIQPGEIRSQSVDLSHAAVLKSLSLNLTGDPMLFFSANANISLWLDSTPAERKTLIYSGVFRSTWSGLSVNLPKGRSWLSVENLGPGQISWVSPSGTTGGAFTTVGGTTTATTAYAGVARGTPVPEPEHVVLLLVCCAAGVFHAWRKSRG